MVRGDERLDGRTQQRPRTAALGRVGTQTRAAVVEALDRLTGPDLRETVSRQLAALIDNADSLDALQGIVSGLSFVRPRSVLEQTVTLQAISYLVRTHSTSVVPLLPRVLAYLGKRLQDMDESQHRTIGELAAVFGVLVETVITDVPGRTQLFERVQATTKHGNGLSKATGLRCLATISDLIDDLEPYAPNLMRYCIYISSITYHEPYEAPFLESLLFLHALCQRAPQTIRLPGMAKDIIEAALRGFEHKAWKIREACIYIIQSVASQELIPLEYLRKLDEKLEKRKYDRVEAVRVIAKATSDIIKIFLPETIKPIVTRTKPRPFSRPVGPRGYSAIPAPQHRYAMPEEKEPQGQKIWIEEPKEVKPVPLGRPVSATLRTKEKMLGGPEPALELEPTPRQRTLRPSTATKGADYVQGWYQLEFEYVRYLDDSTTSSTDDSQTVLAVEAIGRLPKRHGSSESGTPTTVLTVSESTALTSPFESITTNTAVFRPYGRESSPQLERLNDQVRVERACKSMGDLSLGDTSLSGGQSMGT
ncbi:hypothetical protein GMRT_10254 [Giardia muris]|uniref:Uncharacterized protein n=1 Tax=Giardia muris TaxID=5742 RepID=A0A4Z1T5X0_GIAMU|nr:hypothetical protein GMRT_10254 [Giardia muris]|eukprot:TNJ29453.1 hypothetical protein GMRT_10254 [Giardia muris]